MTDLNALTMTEIIRLQYRLQEELARRFECRLALVFSDIVGSTAYFARFGDAAGRQLQQLHTDLLVDCIAPAGGRLVETAGDGAFVAFPSAPAALDGVIAFQNALMGTNNKRALQQQLSVRVGLHWGTVLSDGNAVSGDAVNLCSRVAASAQVNEVRLTQAVFQELTREQRLNCRPLGGATLKGFAAPVELLVLEWRDRALFPSRILIEETDEQFELPARDVLTFGRLPEHHGMQANDIVLSHPDPDSMRQISRWHFELRRSEQGLRLVALSEGLTTVDGQQVERGDAVVVQSGSRIGVANVLTLHLHGADGPALEADGDATMIRPDSGPATTERSA